MRLTRTHVELPLATGATLALPEPAFAHLVRVLRLGEGDACVLFNGDGHDYHARLQTVSKRGAEVMIEQRTAVARESRLRVHLAQAIARGEKMDWILQKCTELGVAGITPVFTERTEVRLDGERGDKRMAHWRGVLASACEQSGRACLPHLEEPQSLAAYAANTACEHRLLLDPEAARTLDQLALQPDSAVTVVIGPEGGLSERDLATLESAGFIGVRIGPRILRTETAGMAVIAALQALYGDWCTS